MTEPVNEQHLVRALELAGEARGGVSPRPPVGAVIATSDGRVIGEGKTEKRPGVHAEVAALRAAGGESRGATLYCTLEPHAHQGVAPACTEEIIAAGISTVVCPVEDPNPQVNGNGFRRLRSAGIEVVTDVSDDAKSAASELIAGFRMLITERRPLITLKYAMSADGRIATATGDSQWITGVEARAAAHDMRRRSDAVVTGIGTVLADDPRLTARDAAGDATGRPLLRVVMDSKGSLSADAALLKEAGAVLQVTGEGAAASHLERAEFQQVRLPGQDGRPGARELAMLLGERGCCEALVEAGGRVAGSFVNDRIVDRVAVFIGPVIVGGAGAPGPVGGEGFDRLADALRLEGVERVELGDDTLITARIQRRG